MCVHCFFTFVKVNWDTVVDKYKRKMGIGVIVRDSMGDLLATLSSLKDYITEQDIVEIMAALRDVQLCHELGFYKVILMPSKWFKHCEKKVEADVVMDILLKRLVGF